jgi:WD40 repeat protein
MEVFFFSTNSQQTIQKCLNNNLFIDQKPVKKTFADKSVDCDIKVEEAEEIDPSDEDLFEENTLISCSDDQTIRIWDLENDTCVKTLKERGPIDRIYEAGGKLISISNERFLKIWDLKTGDLLKSFKAFDDIGQFIFLSDDKFVISVDRDIFVWSLKDNSYCMLRDLHNSEITCLEELSENILITGSNDNIIKVWKLDVKNRNPKNKYKCIKSYGHSSRINSLLIINKSD